jgi:hypothetical protein
VRVMELVPGMQTEVLGSTEPATFVASCPHPLYVGFLLVIWRMPEGHGVGDWSHDALSPVMDLPQRVLPSTAVEREKNLRSALQGRSS